MSEKEFDPIDFKIKQMKQQQKHEIIIQLEKEKENNEPRGS